MSGILENLLDPFFDIQGTDTVDQAKTLADENTGIGDSTQTGTGDSVTAPDGNDLQTLTDAGATFTTADVGRFIVITGMANADNNGTFLVAEYVDGTNIKIYNTNASAGAETSAFSWDIREPYYIGDDINFTRTDRKLIKGTTNYYDDVPTYERPSAIGTDVPANLTNLAGVTLDAKTTVRNVKQDGILFRPSITDSDATLAVSDETFTTIGMHFIAGDLDSFITISGSTDADGTYRIKTVTDGQTLELDGLASLTAEGNITWVLEGDLKGILSARSYADAVDRRGIPIADSGAYDETKYEATFTEVIEPVSGGRPSTEAELPIFARSFGDEKDPNQTATDEGTRFFVQLLTGANDGTATDSSLEIISGRTGSAASLTGGSGAVTGLTGMTDQDIGRWLTVWNLVADEAGHYQIVSVESATAATVTGISFTADASGAVKWQVSRHPGTFDFYNGDRYRSDELSETAFRTTLIGGIQADAELVEDIHEIREFIGAADGDTTPTLTNTGANYIWSDLPDPTDTSVEECLNEINDQVGGRNWTGTILTPGDNITDAIQDLADAISASSITRTIERLAADLPKNTAHTTPITYTLDATDNGRNMFMFVRGVLWDPGPIYGGNRYDETSTNQITPYEKISAGDHINYMVLQ